MPKVQDYSGSSMGNLPIGQGLAVTPIQIADAYAAIANGGMLLKPKLAYAAGCQEEVKPLMAVLVPCLDRVHTKDDFIRFYRFVESIIAYHRYHGGRD